MLGHQGRCTALEWHSERHMTPIPSCMHDICMGGDVSRVPKPPRASTGKYMQVRRMLPGRSPCATRRDDRAYAVSAEISSDYPWWWWRGFAAALASEISISSVVSRTLVCVNLSSKNTKNDAPLSYPDRPRCRRPRRSRRPRRPLGRPRRPGCSHQHRRPRPPPCRRRHGPLE